MRWWIWTKSVDIKADESVSENKYLVPIIVIGDYERAIIQYAKKQLHILFGCCRIDIIMSSFFLLRRSAANFRSCDQTACKFFGVFVYCTCRWLLTLCLLFLAWKVGKTTTSLALMAGLQKRFPKVGFIKPVGQQHVTVHSDSKFTSSLRRSLAKLDYLSYSLLSL